MEEELCGNKSYEKKTAIVLEMQNNKNRKEYEGSREDSAGELECARREDTERPL